MEAIFQNNTSCYISGEVIAHTKKLPLEILLHGIIVADKDVSSKDLIPWKHLTCWQCFEALVNSRIAVGVYVAVASIVVGTIVFSISLFPIRAIGVLVESNIHLEHIDISVVPLGVHWVHVVTHAAERVLECSLIHLDIIHFEIQVHEAKIDVIHPWLIVVVGHLIPLLDLRDGVHPRVVKVVHPLALGFGDLSELGGHERPLAVLHDLWLSTELISKMPQVVHSSIFSVTRGGPSIRT